MTEPSITQIGQYLKDLSFENFVGSVLIKNPPGIDLQVNAEAKPLREPQTAGGKVSGEYEITLSLRATARAMGEDGKPAADDKTLFIAELSYAGRYALANIPQAEVELFLLVEAPRLLFPFARQIIADAAMQGGLPPLLLAPMDFMQLYLARKNQAA
jgi:preprotein translocase subunit SecB